MTRDLHQTALPNTQKPDFVQLQKIIETAVTAAAALDLSEQQRAMLAGTLADGSLKFKSAALPQLADRDTGKTVASDLYVIGSSELAECMYVIYDPPVGAGGQKLCPACKRKLP